LFSSCPGVEDLFGFAAVTINGNTFSSQVIGQKISFFDIFKSGLVGKIDCFGNRIINIFLKSSLHPDMALIRNIMCCHKIIGQRFFWMLFFPLFIKWMDILNFTIKNFTDEFKSKNWLNRA